MMMAIKDRLKELRTALDWSQQTLAMNAGLSLSAVVQIEAGRIDDPRINTLRKLARALGVSLDELAGEEEGEEPKKPRKKGGK
jgi:transcriptional regulator with XRE-family HTH domain